MIRILCLLALIAACSKQPAATTTPTTPPTTTPAVRSSGEMVGLLARAKILPGKEEGLFALLRETARKVQETEPSTMVYLFFRNQKDARELIIFEVYANKAALDAHNKSATMDALRGKLGEFVDLAALKIEITDTAILGFLR